MDCLQLALPPLGKDPGQLADHGDDLLGVVGGVVLEVGGPRGGQGEAGVQQAEAQEEGSTGEERGRDVDHVVLQEGDLDQVLGGHGQRSDQQQLGWTHLSESVLLNIHVTSLGVPAEEVEGERPREVEAESVEDPQLHLPDLPGGVGVVSDVHEVVDLGGVHLLNLAGDEHSRDADQLELVPSDGISLGLK